VAMDSGEYLLSRHPREVTVADARLWIEQGDDEAKQNLADLIYHRLNHRYIEPILQIPRTPVVILPKNWARC
ncbi:MAG: hypothetical protein M0Z43_01110, partial [Acidithiobacillus sp.]|nr:hypothetical protein [Acidithiobacillus sp.]